MGLKDLFQLSFFGKPEKVTSEAPSCPFDKIRHVDENGIEFWMGREFLLELGHSKTHLARTLQRVIEGATRICEIAGHRPEDHFARVGEPIVGGKGAVQEVDDFKLSRRAAYYVALCCDESKEQVALAKNYFAEQTRAQEIGAAKPQIRDAAKKGRRRGGHPAEWMEPRSQQVDFNTRAAAAVRGQGGSIAAVHDGVQEGMVGMDARTAKAQTGIAESDTQYNYWSQTLVAWGSAAMAEITEAASMKKLPVRYKDLRATSKAVTKAIKDSGLKRIGAMVGEECEIGRTEVKDGRPRFLVVQKQLPG